MSLPAQTSTLRRIIVAAALVGVLIASHLWLQERANGFQLGCTGLADGTEAVESGCLDVTTGPYADFLGISNIAWGLGFYVLLVGIRLFYAMSGDDRLRLASLAMTGAGVLYSGYLVYLQAAVIGSFCPVCMGSAATALTLFILHVLEHRRIRTAVTSSPRRAQAVQKGAAALRPYLPLFGVFAVLLGGLVVLANNSTARAEGADNPPTAEAGETPLITVPEGTCAYDPNMEPIADMAPFTSGPYKGSADATVTVVEIFDPNCPHCRDLAESLEPVIEEYGDRARFYMVPFPLRPQSVGQTIALKLATREGKFQDLVDEMFRRQDNQWGMTVEELVETVNAVGMNGAAMQALFEDQARAQPLLDEVAAESELVSAAFALPNGQISVPKVAINGHVVASTISSYSADCMGQFIEEALAGGASATE
jgi:uncharacterized membrane protein/thiol-disulfide isomerase/thioredoxin